MKRILLMMCWASSLLTVKAQQKPHYTQYILNNYIINPALTGIENYADIKLSHRHQWVGIQDAPVTTYLTFHTAVGKKDYRTSATSYRVPGENPRGRNYWEDYTSAEPHHGVGLQVINDRTGPLNRFSAYGTYAYHLGISARTSISAGFGAGISNLSLTTSKLDFGVANPVDPAVFTSQEINNIVPDFNAGVWVYSADYFLGLAVQQIIPSKIDFSNGVVTTSEGKTVPHLFLTGGYRFLLTEDFNMTPSTMVKYVSGTLNADFNIKVQYIDLAWAGVSYRLEEGFAAMVGMNISNALNIGYSYDYTTSKLNTFTKGTHEILVGFIIGNKYGDWCPRNIW
jgi:type IX secretion system PorP/SprF family membrane protein